MTADIRIRPIEAGDADRLYEAARESRKEVYPWLPWCHADYSRDEAMAWTAMQPERFAEEVEYSFAIVDGSRRFLGGCGLNRIDPVNGYANLGYWVRTSHTGRGICTRAVGLLADYAFRETRIIRLEIVCAVENAASRRVAEKAGAIREAVLRDKLIVDGTPADAVLYAILRSDRSKQPETT